MFDFHLHTLVSFDSECHPADTVAAAERAGLREICFTDHYDYNDDPSRPHDLFTMEQYRAAYDGLRSDKVTIRRGVEFGLTPWNTRELTDLASSYDFDFFIGSVHNVDGWDPYYPEYWTNKSVAEGFERYLLQVLTCVKAHKEFDVLGHINYVCKSPHNPGSKPLLYTDYRDICDEIMRTLAENGRGMEINTSGVALMGDYLPAKDFIQRFRELGGEIVTVGSDAHNAERVGQYIDGALEIAKDVFGYVCTFERRKPVFHKL